MMVTGNTPLLDLVTHVYHPHFGGKPEMGVAISS